MSSVNKSSVNEVGGTDSTTVGGAGGQNNTCRRLSSGTTTNPAQHTFTASPHVTESDRAGSTQPPTWTGSVVGPLTTHSTQPGVMFQHAQTTMSFPIICMFRKQAERARKMLELQDASVLLKTDMNQRMVRDIMEMCYQMLSDLNSDDLIRKLGPISAKVTQVLTEKDQTNAKWHCVMGRNFGAWITHERNGILFFSLWDLQILLFKHG